MSFFEDENLCKCVGCGCDDKHACAGGCAWVHKSASGRRGLCDRCLLLGRGFLIGVVWETRPWPRWAATSLMKTCETTQSGEAGKKAAVSGVARKTFGPGSRIYWMTDGLAVAVPPAPRGDLALMVPVGKQKKRRRIAGGARVSARTRGSAALSVVG